MHELRLLPKVDPGLVCVIANEECAACMETGAQEDGMRLLVCGHQPLCDSCLAQWLYRQGHAARCPLCRALMFAAPSGLAGAVL